MDVYICPCICIYFWGTSLFRENTQHGQRLKLKLRPDTCTVIAECDILVNVDDYIQ